MNNTIRIGTYNTGDFSGENIPAGSEEARNAFREVIGSDHVDFWALQEDVEFFDPETKELPYPAVYGSYKNYRRRGNKRYNYKAFLIHVSPPLCPIEKEVIIENYPYNVMYKFNSIYY